MPPLARRLERGFERLLWSSRLTVLVAVLITLLLSMAALVLAAVDVVGLFGTVFRYAAAANDDVRTQAVTSLVKTLDHCLIAALLLIVSFGLYELFINAIDPARETPGSRNLLHVRSLEDLKYRVAKLIVLVLSIEFFQYALRLPLRTSRDLLHLSVGIVLISVAFYVTARRVDDPDATPGRDTGQG